MLYAVVFATDVAMPAATLENGTATNIAVLHLLDGTVRAEGLATDALNRKHPKC